jgi:hypothetical protein
MSYVRGGTISINCFFFKLALVINFVLLFWKLLLFEFLRGISETFLCSVSTPEVRLIPLLDALLLLMLSARFFDIFGIKIVFQDKVL